MRQAVRILPLLILAAAPTAPAADGPWSLQPSGTTARLRGISAAGGGVAWASGADATCLRTTDGGTTWNRVQTPRDADTLDFRDVHAANDSGAVLLSIGPGERSRIYRTADGGASWTLQHRVADPRGFLDAIAFADRDATVGFALGDPVDGRFTVLRTTDAGRTWEPAPAGGLPPALAGEGAFAASGTCLAVLPDGRHAWFGTGGAAVARVFRTADGGRTWEASATPIRAGLASAGVFSVAFRDPDHGVAVGGDYRAEADATATVAVTADGGRTWAEPGPSRPSGFRSAVAYLPGGDGRSLLAVGPSGADRSDDDGRTWRPVPGHGFDALAIEPDAPAGWAAGAGGKIGRYRP